MTTVSLSLPAPRALLFDWDNTLVDTWETIHLALAETFEAFGMEPWTPQQVRERVRASARDTFPRLFGERAEAATAHFYTAFERCHLDGLEVRPGAEACLEALADRGLPLAVVSNKAGRLLRQEAEALGWNRFFGALVGATDAVRDKPAVEPVEMALQPLGLARGPAVWFVGDTDIDLLCAANAGCTGILLRTEPPEAGEFADPAPPPHANDFAALLALVEAALQGSLSQAGAPPA